MLFWIHTHMYVRVHVDNLHTCMHVHTRVIHVTYKWHTCLPIWIIILKGPLSLCHTFWGDAVQPATPLCASTTSSEKWTSSERLAGWVAGRAWRGRERGKPFTSTWRPAVAPGTPRSHLVPCGAPAQSPARGVTGVVL